MNALRFRRATAQDADTVAELIHGSPGREAVALFDGEAPARRFGMRLARARGRMEGWERTVLAERDGVAAGVLQWRIGPGPARISLALALAALRSLGPCGAARAWKRQRIRQRVEPTPPRDAFHIDELHVAARLRGTGIGARLLAYAEAQARASGCRRMSLVTHTDNPAQRLYRRMGFEETERREDPDYFALVGIPGRLLMVKPLDTPAAPSSAASAFEIDSSG